MNRFFSIFGVAFALIFFLNLSSATIICGDSNNICIVSGINNTSATFIDGNTYVISVGTSFRGEGTILTIEPGAVIKYIDTATLTIQGGAKVIANGTSTKRITFTTCRDQTIGADTSTLTNCSADPQYQDYGTALNIDATSGVTVDDSFTFLDFKYGTSAITAGAQINIKEISDCNFLYFVERATTANVIYLIANQIDTNFYNNYFDINAMATNAGYMAINITNSSIPSTYSGHIWNNTFYSKCGTAGYAISVSFPAGLIVNSSIHDNNFTLVNSVGVSSASTQNNTVSIYSNTCSARLLGRTCFTFAGAGNILNGDIHDNNFDLLTSYGFTGVTVNGNIYNNRVQAITTSVSMSITTLNGNFYNNDITATSSSGLTATTMTGDIHDNNFDVNTSIAITSSFLQGDIYNNLFDLDLVATGLSMSNTSGYYIGTIRDNNFQLFTSTGISITATGKTNYSFNSNTCDLNGNAAAYYCLYSNGGMVGNISDNNFNITRTITNGGGIHLASTLYGIEGDIKRNNFNVTTTGNAISILGYVKGEVSQNLFDINSTTGAYKAIGIRGDSTCQIIDNNFILKSYSSSLTDGIQLNGTSFQGNILRNRFNLLNSNGIRHVSSSPLNGDINSNYFDSNITTSSPSWAIRGVAAGTITGNICENTIIDYYGTFITLTGPFVGNICKNSSQRINQTSTGTNFFISTSTLFTGSIFDNNFISFYSTSLSYQLITISSTASFLGDIHDNLFEDMNNASTANTTSYIINVPGSFTGNIYNNTFDNLNNLATAARVINIIYFSGINQVNIFDNNFTNINATLLGYFIGINLTGGVVRGSINDNVFDNWISNSSILQTAMLTTTTLSANVSNNIFRNFSRTMVVSATAGNFDGNFNDNIIENISLASGNYAISLGATSMTGSFYNNIFKNIMNISGASAAMYVASTSFSGSIYNNLFTELSGASNTSLRLAMANSFAGNITNNTFVNFIDNCTACYGIWNSGVIIGDIKRNIFANGKTALNGTFQGTVSNNAFYSITTIGGTTAQHEDDINLDTGLTNNPFVLDGTDRNYILNDNANGGALLVNAGLINTDDFFKMKTTQSSGELDKNILDLGYHYNQIVPYAQILSPNGGEFITGNKDVTFLVEAVSGLTGIDINFYYSSTNSGGTFIEQVELSSLTCSGDYNYTCHYTWDASNVTDGNYYFGLTLINSNGSYTDYSDNNFFVLSIPKIALRTYKASKPRSFFASGEDVNIVVLTNSLNPTITIIDSNSNTLVNQANLTGSPGTYYYTFNMTGEYGWMDVKISGKTIEKALYHSKTWINKFTDSDSSIFPFSFDLNIQEPNTNQRWFWLTDINTAFARVANPISIRVLDFNGTDYIQIPCELHEYTANENGLITAGKIMFLVSLDKNEKRQFYVSYSRVDSDKEYSNELNLISSDTDFNIENSNFTANISSLFGGILTDLTSKIGSMQSMVADSTMLTDIWAQTSFNKIHSASETEAISIEIDQNNSFEKKIIVIGKTNTDSKNNYLDYNISYTFYTKQPYFIVDYNIKPNTTFTLTSLMDNYFYVNETLFNNATISQTNTISRIDINSYGEGTGLSEGDAQYFGVYKKETGDGYGEIQLNKSSNKTLSTTTIFNDNTEGSSFEHKIYAGSVSASTYFNINEAKTVFNPWNDEEDLNKIYYNLKNPLTFQRGITATGDNTNPTINTFNYTPLDINDSTDLNFSINATDNLIILSIDINAVQNEQVFYQTESFEDQEVNTSFLIPDENTHAGDINVTVIVTDIAGNTDTQSILLNLTDLTPPSINNIQVTPDGNINWDPGTTLTIDANITEYYNLAQVNLFTREYDANSENDWNEVTMDFNLIEGELYNYTASKDYNLPEDRNIILQYFVNTIDTSGNDTNSSIHTIYSEYDYTWTLSNTSFTELDGIVDSNINIPQFNIHNTGDKNITFNLYSNWEDTTKIYYNNSAEEGFTFILEPDSNLDINAIVTTKSSDSISNLIITINAIETQAKPDSNTISGTIISRPDGPYLFLEMSTYPLSVTQEDTDKEFILKITNKGNQTASQADINWTLPNGWSLSFGDITSTLTDILEREIRYVPIKTNISSTATTGNQSVSVSATPDSDYNKTKTKTVTTLVNAKSSQGGNDDDDDGGGSGGSGGGSGGNDSSGGSSSPFVNTQQKDLFFQTNEFFELVRGQDNSFNIKFTNPLKYKLIKLKLSVEGILTNYLNLKNNYIPELDSNQEHNTQIEITSPKYFNPGQYQLTFTINGYYLSNNKEIPFKETRNIQLLIHDTNQQTAQNYLNQIQEYINELTNNNLKLNQLPTILTDANKLYNNKDYDTVKTKFLEAQTIFNNAIDATTKNKNISGLINLATNQGLDTPNTNRLLALAQLALQRGDYSLALSRLKEAELTYSLETKGELNLLIWALANIDKIIIITILAILAIILFTLGFNLLKIDNQLKQLNSENNLLLQMITDLQKKSFIENKISLGEYYDALSQFENRIAQVSEKFIQLTTKKTNMLTFSTQSTKLKKERKSLLDLLRETQKQYFSLGLIETRLYQTKIQSVTKRLSEVDEQIVTDDLTKTIKTNQKGIFKYIWRLYYKIFK